MSSDKVDQVIQEILAGFRGGRSKKRSHSVAGTLKHRMMRGGSDEVSAATSHSPRGGEYVQFEGGKHRVYRAINGRRFIRMANGRTRFVSNKY